MKVFAISDLHLSTAVEKPMDIFGDGWQNHFAKISEDWQSKVTDGDLVLLGGDMSWGLTADEAAPDYALVEALNGKKFVVRGNHDYYWSTLSKMRAKFPAFNFVQNNAYREQTQSGAGIVIAGSRGWTIPAKDTSEDDIKIFKREIIRLDLSLSTATDMRQDGDVLIALLHYPPFDANYQDTEVTALLEKYNVDYALYGHLHGKNVRVTPRFKKNGVEYILTSCDLVENKVIKVCDID